MFGTITREKCHTPFLGWVSTVPEMAEARLEDPS